MEMVLIALGIILILPIKHILLYAILTRLNPEARPSAFTTLSLKLQ